VAAPDEVTTRLFRIGHKWRSTHGLSDAEVSDLVRHDQIDVLVDQDGHAGGNRLLVFARKPAPVQVSFNGYVDTTGLRAMDYRLTDEFHDPPGASEELFTEQLMRLPQCVWCYLTDQSAPDVSPLPAERNGRVTFGSFNKVIKVSPHCAALWATILRALPSSLLVVAAVGGEDNSDVRQMLERAGVPSNQLQLLPKASTRRDYMARFNAVDICLDTFPFNGITTTCDALWMGTPVVTLAGVQHVARAGVSLLTAAGHPEWIAPDHSEYVKTAVGLGSDLKNLSRLRSDLRSQFSNSCIVDGPSYARRLEEAFRTMWRAWCKSALH
jgi:predicted O-linked N-acetylglucosamine transferase (SPINDLY family)